MNSKVLQLHKRDSFEFKYIQDKYAFCKNSRLFSLADGTTQSFKSEVWAKLLTKSFIAKPSFSPIDLIGNFTECVKEYKNAEFEYSANPAIASLEKAKQTNGGTATFVGVQLKENNHLEVISCGDSNLFIVNSRYEIHPFPFKDVSSLDSNNRFINTEELIKGGVNESYFSPSPKTFKYRPNDIIILATDALSRLILDDKDNIVIPKLLQIESFDELHSFCLEYWGNRRLQEDDFSAIIISTSNLNDPIKEIHPPKGFSFPRIESKEFVPSTINTSQADMKQIPNQLNNISDNLAHINNKIKFNKILIFILLLFTSLNSLILFFNRSNSNSNKTSEKVEQSEILVEPEKSSQIKDVGRIKHNVTSEIPTKSEVLNEEQGLELKEDINGSELIDSKTHKDTIIR